MKGFFLFIILLKTMISYGTHNRAGEIAFRQIGLNQFEITLLTYTVPPLTQEDADRPIIEISWGDGSSDSLIRSINFPQFITSGVNINEYKGTHTFPGPGTYKISLEDPNRNADIINVPNSVNVPFYIESEIIINPFLGENDSPVLLNPPVEEACRGAVFQHNPSAFDGNGDSLVFSLIEGKGLNGEAIPGYTFPEGIAIDQGTGTITWDNPTVLGEFNFAILIQEYRNGFLIGSMTRDMQVNVSSCSNTPPIIQDIQDICIEAGTLLNLPIRAFDNDSNQAITLTATGGPLTEVNGDLAEFSEVVGIDSVEGNLTWLTGCPHVRSAPYQIFLKAQDNDNNVPLIDLFTLNITVIGPKVKNVSTQASLNGISVSWSRNICEEVVGYHVYRKPDSLLWIPDSCETGIPPDRGYTRIGTLNHRDSTQFLDQDVIDGNIYCYRIVAVFADGAESIASKESCAETFETDPIPLNADVLTTDSTNGSVFVRWKNPKNIDSLNLSNNAYYSLYTLTDGNPVLLYSSNDILDTTFLHQNINTQSTQHIYKIDLIDQNTVVSNSLNFSSVFLQSVPADRLISLEWNYSTPWFVDSSIVFKSINNSWIPVDTVRETYYTDYNLINGTEYCYRVLTLGQYTSNASDTFLFNQSQEICATPQDITPPCIPIISSSSECDINTNLLWWSSDTLGCNGDMIKLDVFFKRYPEDEYTLLFTQNAPWSDTSYTHDSRLEVAGCYAFSATDSVGNTSEIGHEICFDNCPSYQLPNIFTPNGDNINETFIPFPYKYVEQIQLSIYNRWGQIVFKTNSPNINWDGISSVTKRPCPSGVYFYSCLVSEQRLEGVQSRILNGFVHIIR